MNKQTNKKIPKSENEYTIKFVFDNKSNVDINEILKKCFMNEIKDKNIMVHHSI